jgi:hypothetical protein
MVGIVGLGMSRFRIVTRLRMRFSNFRLSFLGCQTRQFAGFFKRVNREY